MSTKIKIIVRKLPVKLVNNPINKDKLIKRSISTSITVKIYLIIWFYLNSSI